MLIERGREAGGGEQCLNALDQLALLSSTSFAELLARVSELTHEAALSFTLARQRRGVGPQGLVPYAGAGPVVPRTTKPMGSITWRGRDSGSINNRPTRSPFSRIG